MGEQTRGQDTGFVITLVKPIPSLNAVSSSVKQKRIAQDKLRLILLLKEICGLKPLTKVKYSGIFSSLTIRFIITFQFIKVY